jgi:hypothetical protein
MKIATKSFQNLCKKSWEQHSSLSKAIFYHEKVFIISRAVAKNDFKHSTLSNWGLNYNKKV